MSKSVPETRSSVELPEYLRGSYAERLAVVRADAEHALWAVQHGADWPRAWRSCPRVDWLLEAWMLTECPEAGCAGHRRVVGWLAEQAKRAWFANAGIVPVDVNLPIRAAVDFAERWSRGAGLDRPIGALAALALSCAFDPARGNCVADRAGSVVAAALRAAASVHDPASIPAAGRALSFAAVGAFPCREVAERFASEFEVPTALRCDLPS